MRSLQVPWNFNAICSWVTKVADHLNLSKFPRIRKHNYSLVQTEQIYLPGRDYCFRMRERNAVLRFVLFVPFFAFPTLNGTLPSFARRPSKTICSGPLKGPLGCLGLPASPSLACLRNWLAPARPKSFPARPARD